MKSIFLWPAIYFLLIMALFSCSGNEQNNHTVSSNKESAQVPQESDTVPDRENDTPVILFFGNSLTAGYGLDDPDDAFPGLIQDKLDSLGYHYLVVNAGLSGETTASGNNRIDWVLENQPIDIFVLELGANDGLRGISPLETQRNLEQMIDKVRKKSPDAKIILAGMEAPPNMGPEFTSQFRLVFKEIAQEKEISLIPFLLANVAGEKELNQGDGIHPTEKGNQIVAENVWKVLKDKLEPAS